MLDIAHSHAEDAGADLGGRHLLLVRDAQEVLRSLGVGGYGHDGLVVVLYGDVDALSSSHGGGDIGEEALDGGLDLVYIDVPDDDQRLLVGAVPLLVVVAQHLVGEVTDDVHLTDRHALAVLVAREGELEEALLIARVPAITAAPLLLDDAALGVDLLVLEAEAIAPVVEDEDAAIHDALAWDGDVHQRVDGLVEAGVGVDVAPEAGADAFEEVVDALAGEVLRPVEGNVLEEVRQSALAILLLHRADALDDVELRARLGLGIMADEVAQAVGELAHAHGRIKGQGRDALGGLRSEGSDPAEGGDSEGDHREEGQNALL